MRDIFVLGEAIKNSIPNTSDGLEIKRRIDEITFDFRYTAPELWVGWFERMATFLQRTLGKPDTEWKVRIDDLFSDKIKIEGDQ